MDETVTQWDEGYGFKIRLHDGKKDKPFPGSYFIYAIKDIGHQQTEFTATMGYQFPFGAIGKLIDNLLIYPIVNAQILDVALAVKHYYETGETPSAADIKRLRQQS